ncbi:MAG: fasciclin domain-containing protein [Sphingomicrobium sp.]
MRKTISLIMPAAIGLGLAACDSNNANEPASKEAKEAAGDATIASSLGGDTSTFQQAVKSAGLETTLAGPGPYTVLVPVNTGFEKLPAGALDTLLKPEAREQLTKVLTMHILSGTVLAADIEKAIDNGGGKTQLMTIGGGQLTATKDGDKVVLTDAAGGKSVVTKADLKQSNGVVHQVDAVLMPS